MAFNLLDRLFGIPDQPGLLGDNIVGQARSQGLIGAGLGILDASAPRPFGPSLAGIVASGVRGGQGGAMQGIQQGQQMQNQMDFGNATDLPSLHSLFSRLVTQGRTNDAAVVGKAIESRVLAGPQPFAPEFGEGPPSPSPTSPTGWVATMRDARTGTLRATTTPVAAPASANPAPYRQLVQATETTPAHFVELNTDGTVKRTEIPGEGVKPPTPVEQAAAGQADAATAAAQRLREIRQQHPEAANRAFAALSSSKIPVIGNWVAETRNYFEGDPDAQEAFIQARNLQLALAGIRGQRGNQYLLDLERQALIPASGRTSEQANQAQDAAIQRIIAELTKKAGTAATKLKAATSGYSHDNPFAPRQ